ncbi:hypothetical protein BDW02DRAFT_556455 [Decorospora gaudefroyi]|uniref:Uncharacterized protein n=1 Tax=Decorospora gaudefroyi TaxID=184978 RepID=A0A6A5K1Q7_9PLEO|nr:hypothetical protein BDW02DRAFT_556455 [Decorospora gaudefroyi]
MRYDDWDVILFPKDSHVPIQEFKTACYVSPEEYGQQLPTLTCYISSLPPSTPFRISVHSWATSAKVSTLIDSRRKANQKVVYIVQVIVDGARVFRGFFDIASKWPQEIAHEKRSLAFPEPPTSQRKPCLEFPPFHQQTLMQNSWDACDPNGRIKILLSEQLISKTASPGELDLGVTNNIVCFSFQHAPKDVLEQAGISWPIRNPLYLPNALDRAALASRTSPSSSWTPNPRHQAGEILMQSPLSQTSKTTLAKPHNPEANRRPNSHLPPISHFSKPPTSFRGSGRTEIWDDNFNALGDGADDISMDTWSTKRTTSGSTSDLAMPDYMYTSGHSSRQGPPWTRNMSHFDHSTSTDWDDHRSRREKERQLVVTLRDDQLGQIIEAISPPKTSRELPHGFSNQRHEQTGQPPTAHTYYPPRMGAPPLTNRPPSAAMAHTLSYPDFNSALRNASNKRSPNQQYSHDAQKDRPPMMYHPSSSSHKENNPPSQSRLPTPFPHANRVPTPNPFAQRQPTFNSDVSMRDPSSALSSMYRFNRGEAQPPAPEMGKVGSAHAPSAVNVRSRKEGISDSPKLSDQATRHDQSLLPAMSVERRTQRPTSKGQERCAHSNQKNVPELVEVIDVDAIDPSLGSNASLDHTKLSPFKANHKPGASLSSIDSTGRLERQLFSALGEELGSFDQEMDTTGMGPELAQALGGGATHSELSGSTILNSTTGDFEPPIKRKRQGTLGGDRDRSPTMKKEKASFLETETPRGEVVVRLRGGE